MMRPPASMAAMDGLNIVIALSPFSIVTSKLYSKRSGIGKSNC
jgi:hypothetical protein